MKILVDADACPGRDVIERAAEENGIEVIMFCDLNHVIDSSYSKIIYADSGFQSVDMKLANEAKKGDIVVTQDFGVATMALSKRAYAIGPKGYIYNDDNIDKLLFERHISSKVRRAGGKTSNAKKRSKEDDKRLYENLKFLIEKSLSAIDYI
ncbi:YaiI/YqxD family protein [Haloimpatiens massiliensis]|uniref:YaiI/YqxD family protein n=1 Tax=Haloimpatiens massiliensis TaxID=1658110 RepID=UPI000C84CCF6|nr:YaiI/YqxD family protein [Haloimpatiens massiliensis]